MGDSPTREQALEAGRAAHAAKAWAGAVHHLREAEGGAALEAADLELLAEATYLIGRKDEAIALWTRAHKAWLATGAGGEADQAGQRLAGGIVMMRVPGRPGTER